MQFPRFKLGPPAPFVTGRWEMLIMRGLLALLTWQTFPILFPPRIQTYPTGAGRFIDFSFLGDPSILSAMNWALVVAGILFTLGRLVPLALGYMTAAMIAYGCLRNAQGAISHDTQVLALALLAGWVADLVMRFRKTPDRAPWIAFCNPTGRRRDLPRHRSHQDSRQRFVACRRYQLPGADREDLTHALLFGSRGGRARQKRRILGHRLRYRPSDARFPHRPSLAQRPDSWLRSYHRDHLLPRPSRSPTGARLGLAAAGFHVGVYALMGLKFETNIWIVLILFVNAPFWISLGIRPILKK